MGEQALPLRCRVYLLCPEQQDAFSGVETAAAEGVLLPFAPTINAAAPAPNSAAKTRIRPNLFIVASKEHYTPLGSDIQGLQRGFDERANGVCPVGGHAPDDRDGLLVERGRREHIGVGLLRRANC
jgi:hypothetical protein